MQPLLPLIETPEVDCPHDDGPYADYLHRNEIGRSRSRSRRREFATSHRPQQRRSNATVDLTGEIAVSADHGRLSGPASSNVSAPSTVRSPALGRMPEAWTISVRWPTSRRAHDFTQYPGFGHSSSLFLRGEQSVACLAEHSANVIRNLLPQCPELPFKIGATHNPEQRYFGPKGYKSLGSKYFVLLASVTGSDRIRELERSCISHLRNHDRCRNRSDGGENLGLSLDTPFFLYCAFGGRL